jgi:hypothetical protein
MKVVPPSFHVLAGSIYSSSLLPDLVQLDSGRIDQTEVLAPPPASSHATSSGQDEMWSGWLMWSGSG